MTRLKALSLCAAVVAGVAARANAATIVYQNTTTQVGGFVFNGAATVGTDLATNIDINKLTMTPGSTGDTITSLSFQVFNNNNAAVGVRPIMYLWADNGAGGLPGTLVGTFALPLSTFANGPQTVTESVTSSGITIPADRVLWAGLGFDNDNGASSITAAQLNNVGGLTYFPATVGTAATTAYFLAPGAALTNPAVAAFDANSTGDYGWTVQAIAAAVPEPSSLLLFISGIALIAARRRGR